MVIINFGLKKENKQKDLNDLLKKAKILQDAKPYLEDEISVINFQGLRDLFEKEISCLLLEKKYIQVELFLCATYIAQLLSKLTISIPNSWFLFDTIKEALENNDPHKIQDGANLCFVLCSIFEPRSNHRLMKKEYYEDLGSGLFYDYYCRTGQDVAFFMSKEFNLMTTITSESFCKMNNPGQ